MTSNDIDVFALGSMIGYIIGLLVGCLITEKARTMMVSPKEVHSGWPEDLE